MKILIVDDDPDVVEILSTMIDGWGHTSKGVLNGIDALASIEDDCPDVVLSDLRMPGMNGIALLHEIRARRDTCPVFFVLMTGKASVSDVVEAICDGADDYIPKPIDQDCLQALLEKHHAKVR